MSSSPYLSRFGWAFSEKQGVPQVCRALQEAVRGKEPIYKPQCLHQGHRSPDQQGDRYSRSTRVCPRRGPGSLQARLPLPRQRSYSPVMDHLAHTGKFHAVMLCRIWVPQRVNSSVEFIFAEEHQVTLFHECTFCSAYATEQCSSCRKVRCLPAWHKQHCLQQRKPLIQLAVGPSKQAIKL